MALRRKMYYPVNIVFCKNFCDSFLVADIGLYKGIIFSVFNILQIFQISRISQGIHIDNPNGVTVLAEHIMNVVGADKTGTACYQICSHIIPPVFIYYPWNVSILS